MDLINFLSFRFINFTNSIFMGFAKPTFKNVSISLNEQFLFDGAKMIIILIGAGKLESTG